MDQIDIMIENQRLRDINPNTAGTHECDPGYTVGPFTRDYYLLHYVMSGQGSYTSPKARNDVFPNQMFIIRPGEKTVYAADERDPWHYVWISFSCHIDVGSLLARDVIDLPEGRHIFQEIAGALNLKDGRELFICAKLYELLSLLRSKQAPQADRTSQYAHMAQNFIHTNYMRDISVARIAASLGLDRSYFSQVFKQYTGKPPQQYIVDYRLERAAQMMAQGAAPGEAARQAGYEDIVNFSRMFKRRYGVAPSRYRG
jgi:AraC-like DNA-binding protein